MLANTSQLIIRNIDDLKGNVLIVEPVSDELAQQLKLQAPQLRLSCYTTDQAAASKWQHSDIALYFDVSPAFNQIFDTIVLYYPKSKEQLAFTLSQLKPAISADTVVYVVGDNKGGIKSLSSHAAKLGLAANKLDNAKHCLWFSLHGDFSALSSKQATGFNVSSGDIHFTAYSLPGVFNHGKLDIGTALLLQHLPTLTNGKVLDFACGSGVIGAMLKLKQPGIELYCSDISALAVASAQITLKHNNLTGLVIAADGLPAKPAQFDAIVSNPPFHTGIKTDYSIVEEFIRQSALRLSAKGSLTIVANSHLEYLELLQASFKNVQIKAKANGFIVYQATKG